MAGEFDVEQFTQVLHDYPWLVPLLQGAERWQNEDGSGGFRCSFEDLDGKVEGFRALAEATGATFEELPRSADHRRRNGAENSITVQRH